MDKYRTYGEKNNSREKQITGVNIQLLEFFNKDDFLSKHFGWLGSHYITNLTVCKTYIFSAVSLKRHNLVCVLYLRQESIRTVFS